MYPHLPVAELAYELDPAAAGRRRAGPVLDAAAPDAEVVGVDRRAVGDEQLEGGVVDVERDLDLAALELGEQEVEHDDAARGAHVEPMGRCTGSGSCGRISPVPLSR